MRSTRAATSSLVLLVLLVLAVGINYVDRGSLSVAKTEVAAEFQLDDIQMGLLFSAFFWSYALCQIVAGWFVDRYDVKWVYAIGFLIWSVATLAMGLVTGFAVFLAMRVLMGLGESVAYPATSRIVVENFPEQRRGLVNALIDAASKIGPALTVLLGGLFVAQWGWRPLFLLMGGVSLLWLLPWIAFVPSRSSEAADLLPPDERPRVGFDQLLTRREVWGTALGFFCLGYAWYFLLSWLPAYLEEARGFSKDEMAIFGSLPLWAMAATAVFGGWLSDWLIGRGWSTTRVRKSFLIAGFLPCAVFLYAGATVSHPTACVVLLTAACASLGLYTSNAWAVTQTLAGPLAAGRWSGIQNAIGNMGGVVSPALTGLIIERTGSYNLAFTGASLMLVVGVFAYVLLIDRVAPIDWESPQLTET